MLLLHATHLKYHFFPQGTAVCYGKVLLNRKAWALPLSNSHVE